VKRTLDLRTGKTVWSAYRAPKVAARRLTRDVRADVLVVGMGISGAMIAEALTADGHAVVVIDRRGPLLGSTPATTALVQFEVDQPLSILTGKIGRDRAERGWRRSRLAIAGLKARIDHLGIACNVAERQSLYLAGTILGPTGLKEEIAARRAAGLSAEYLAPSELRDRYGIDRRGALLSHGNLALDPRKLASGLLNAAAKRGAVLYAPVEATAFSETTSGVKVSTGDGPTISAKHVVLATGYELAEPVPDRGHRIVSTYAMATRPQPSHVMRDMPLIWESSDPYLYLRTTDDGRIICGGEDEEFADEEARDALLPQKIKRISAKLKKLMPALDTNPEFAWAGSFGTTASGLPIIGKVPQHPRLIAAMGYGGNGITWSQIASELIRTELSGNNDHDADLFAFAG